jgi:hypothetical protein
MELRIRREAREGELVRELSALDERLAAVARLDDRQSKCVASYLKQFSKNKRGELATLRYRRHRE